MFDNNQMFKLLFYSEFNMFKKKINIYVYNKYITTKVLFKKSVYLKHYATFQLEKNCI